MKKLICFILTFCLCVPLTPKIASAAAEDFLSDEDFFGVWDSTSNDWSTVHPGKLQYKGDSTWEDLGRGNWSEAEKNLWLEVESYAKMADYQNAGAKLHEYYETRTNNSFNPTYTTSAVKGRKPICDLYLDNFRWNGTSMLAKSNFIDTFGKVSFDVSKNVDASGSYTFVLLGHTTDGAEVTINSRESASNQPVLVVESGGIEHTFAASKDTCIKPNANKDTNYSSSASLLVYEGKATETALFNDSTARAYLQFDVSGLSNIAAARLELYGSTQSGTQSVSVWTDGNTIWEENSLTWNNALIKIVNFSDCEGGVDWQLMKNDTTLTNTLADTIARGYWMTHLAEYTAYSKNQTFADNTVAQLKDFINDAELGDTDRAGVGYSNGLTTAIRAREFVTVFYHMLPYISDADCVMFLKYMWHMTEYLSRSENFRTDHNWGTFQLYGYLRNTSVITEFKQSGEWFDQGVERVGQMIDALFNSSDGSYKEGSSSYGVEAISNLFTIKNEISGFGVELTSVQKEKLRKGVSYLINILNPDGTDIMYGDSKYEKHTFTNIINYLGDETLKYIVTNGAQGIKPHYTSIHYPSGGNKFAVMRNGWTTDALALYTNNGAGNGLSHTHPDNLAVTAYGYGERLLVDVGNFSYDDNPISNWMRRSTQAHNTVTINGDVQSTKRTDPISIWRTNDKFDFFSATTKAYSGFPHTRNIYFLKNGFWIVSDLIMPETEGTNSYEQNWHMLPANAPTIDNINKTGRSNNSGKANISVVQAKKRGINVELKDGYSSAQGDGLRNEKFVSFTQQGEGTVAYCTLLYPHRAGVNDIVTARQLDTGVSDDSEASAMEIGINGKNTLYYISHNETPVLRRFGNYEYRGKAIYLDMSGSAKSADIVNGTVLRGNGQTLFTSEKTVDDLQILWDEDRIELTSSSLVERDLANVSLFPINPTSDVTLNGESVPFSLSGGMLKLGGEAFDDVIIDEDFEDLPVGTYTGHDGFTTYTGPSDAVTGYFDVQADGNNKRLRLYRNSKYTRDAKVTASFTTTGYNFVSFEMEFSLNPTYLDAQTERITLGKSGSEKTENVAQLTILDGEFSYTEADGTLVSLQPKIAFVPGQIYYLKILADKDSAVYSIFLQTVPIDEDSVPVAAGIPLRNKSAYPIDFNTIGYSCTLKVHGRGGETVYIDNIKVKSISRLSLGGSINGKINLKKQSGLTTADVYVAGSKPKGVLIFARYDNNMKLFDTVLDSYNDTSRGGQVLKVQGAYGEQDTVRAFLWSSLTDMIPITNTN